MKDLTTKQLLNIIKNVANNALLGYEDKSADEICDMAHAELRERSADRGVKVRLSNLKNNDFGEKAYICGVTVDGLIVESWFEKNAQKAKSYKRV